MKEYIEDDGVLVEPQTGEEFSFPFEPYKIQLDFMKNLFSACENGNFGIFQSPTGTGKTLSLLCGSLSWLFRDNERHTYATPKWIVDQKRQKRVKERQQEIEDMQEKFDEWEKKIRKKETQMTNARRRELFAKTKKRGADKHSSEQNGETEGALAEEILDDYISENETGGQDNQVREWLKCFNEGKIYNGGNSDIGNEDDPSLSYQIHPEPQPRKVVYASRTHSQLKQTIKELKRTKFWTERKIRSVTIGSRMQLCINSKIKKSSITAGQLNEKCIEMQKSTKKKTSKCPYLHKEHTPTLDFVSKCRSDVLDIEDLVKVGNEMEVCPYYGARQAIQAAQIVFIPYNLLLVQDSRESLGLDLTNSIVIIDEAHNLIDSICNTHGSTLSWEVSKLALELTKAYFSHYWKRLNNQNTIYVRQLITLLKSICKYFDSKVKSSTKVFQKDQESIKKAAENKSFLEFVEGMTPNTFIGLLKIEGINVFKLLKFLRTSQFSHKLTMFSDRIAKEKYEKSLENNIANKSNNKTSLSKKQRLVSNNSGNNKTTKNSLGNSNNSSSRMFISLKGNAKNEPENGKNEPKKNSNDNQIVGELKYVLMDPSDAFKTITELPRAVILAGGTMNPIDDIVNQLGVVSDSIDNKEIKNGIVPYVKHEEPKSLPKKLHVFECSHVVPKNNISAMVLGKGPNNHEINLSYAGQNSEIVVKEAGFSLARLVKKIPGGMVVFFPSYSFLYSAYEKWIRNGIISEIQNSKKVFCEPRSKTSTVKSEVLEKTIQKETTQHKQNSEQESSQDVLLKYKSCIQEHGGAILLAVVSGNMSEGIDFSDSLARAVVMVGVPYPNLHSMELVEKIKFYQNKHNKVNVKNSEKNSSNTKFDMDRVGFEYYENLCMRAVNQSIGRAIRHINDYAIIILMDKRYSSPSITKKLPGWVLGNEIVQADKKQMAQSFSNSIKPPESTVYLKTLDIDSVFDKVVEFFAEKPGQNY
ncbi:hypothetical protein BB559_002471 [Furculomyces boomerangus]|uniref:ATP-dependent DNA helicase CHL1 n=1 Tax=Furculomyces boomerangus TaxID=61424 RepID=A0A2T9YV13_9FUNG|nr:hypothetical protein BB559_002471 [Furculomyces boomerangus]